MDFQNKILNKIGLTAAYPVALVISISIMLFGCGSGNTHQQETGDTSANSTYTPSSAAAPYDASKIDPNAPVMELKLQGIGNSMDVMSYSTQEIRVKAGTTVKVHFTNTATDPALKHNFFIVKNGTMEQVANEALAAGADKNYIPDDKSNILFSSDLVAPGQSEDLTFAAPPAGQYQFVCTYPGHWQKMNGRFIVE